MTALASRIAGAPISWGVSEVPGWGHQLPPSTVLSQMAKLGLRATEFGPDTFLPADPQRKLDLLTEYDLRAVGQFVPLVLHLSDVDPIDQLDAVTAALELVQADTLVVAASTGVDGYDSRVSLTDTEWANLLANLARIEEFALARGVHTVLHPHAGTVVESDADVERVLAGSSVKLCLDTGHLLVGGSDPSALAAKYADRVGHVHLKDVQLGLAEQVQAGELPFADAVRAGMFVPLGEGDVHIDRIVRDLENGGYRGWYVVEQDTVLDADPGVGPGSPMDQMSISMRYLLDLA